MELGILKHWTNIKKQILQQSKWLEWLQAAALVQILLKDVCELQQPT